MHTVIKHATVVTPNGILPDAAVAFEDGVIVRIDERSNGKEAQIDAGGRYLLPGFIDMHSDAIEKEIEPRPGAVFPLDVAIYELDKRLASCGVTTMYHSISFAENEVGLRSNKTAATIAARLRALAPVLTVQTKVHARYEVTDIGALPYLKELVEQEGIDLLSVMDHTPGQGQFKEIMSFKNYYGRVYRKSDEELERIIATKMLAKERIGEESLQAVIGMCKRHDIPLASHDDDTAEKVRWLSDLGITISEFPVTLEAARAASGSGLSVCLGAPNILRGNSQSRNLSARDAIAQGWCDIICSDYSPMSMLHAVFALAECGMLPLHEAVNMVSTNPARALGIAAETGALEVGKSADMVLVAKDCVPRVLRTWVAGREVFATC